MNAADLLGNSRRFILFTVFYNARAYYPVLAILFLDLGLTLDQFRGSIWSTCRHNRQEKTASHRGGFNDR